MVEVLKHVLGICGDGHPSLLFGISSFTTMIVARKQISTYVKSLLQAFLPHFFQHKK